MAELRRSKMPTSNARRDGLSFGRILKGVRNRVRILVGPMIWLPSRYFYGNFAGFWNNLLPRVELARYRTRANTGALEVPTSVRGQAGQLKDSGFLLFPRQLTYEKLAHIVAKYSEHIEDRNSSLESPNGATRFVYKPLVVIPELRALLTEDVSRIIRAYYACSFRIVSIRAWRNYHVKVENQEKEDVFSNTFHNDGTPLTGLRLFVLLSDGVTRKTGSLRFHDKPTSKSLVRRLGFLSRWLMSKSVQTSLTDPLTLRYFEGDTGEACLANTQECLHAASIPEKGAFRDIVQFEIAPCRGPMRDINVLFDETPDDYLLEEMRHG